MSIIAFLILAWFFLTGRYAGRGFHADYVEKDAILSVKGVFILLVTLSHFAGYGHSPFAWDALFYVKFQEFHRQMVVVPFLFFSGYGVFLSLRDKGDGYFRGFLVNRVLRVLFQFDLAVLPYFLLALFAGKHFGVGKIVGGFTAWTSFGNSNWYIFTVVVLYLLTWLAFLPFRRIESARRETAALATLAVFVPLMMSTIAAFERPEVFYNTCFAYLAGAAFAVVRKRFEEAFLRENGVYGIILGLLVVGFLVMKTDIPNLFQYECASILFAFIVVLVIAKVKNTNPLLTFCGRHLFSIYILQRLPMNLLKETPVAASAFVYLGVSFASTIALCWMFDKIVPWLWNRMCFSLTGGRGV